MALFAPEIVLYIAYAQYTEAPHLIGKLNQLRCDSDKVNSSQDEDPENAIHTTAPEAPVQTGATKSTAKYDLRYGFFIVMGGCATKNVEEISSRITRATITPKGAIKLAKEGFFIDVSRNTISDKSSANSFGKGLVCIQVLWFVVQCIARAIASYPLVLIEIHTMVHVACAIMMYILWWEVSNDYLL